MIPSWVIVIFCFSTFPLVSKEQQPFNEFDYTDENEDESGIEDDYDVLKGSETDTSIQ